MPDGEDDEQRSPRLWRPVDPDIWAPPPDKNRLERIVQRLLEAAKFFSFAFLVTLGPLSILLSVFLVYSLVRGGALFGPVFLMFWAVVIVGFVIVLEKSGYARHFEDWEFRLGKRVLAVPVAFLIIASIYFLFYLSYLKRISGT